MPKTQELIVIAKTYDLILWSCNHTGKFPRNHRFVLGERIERNLYDNPARAYKTMRIDKWTVPVEKQLLSETPTVARLALARLKAMLPKALAALPPPSRANIRKLPIYLLYGPRAKAGGRDDGLEYFQKDAPKHHKHLDPRWGSCVVIYCAENYARISAFWALKALVHEFAHAYHLEQWPEKQPDILRAWDHAVEQSLYRNVTDDSGKKIDKAYALVNQLEYFAELSCMYFVGCNYQPFNRKQLQAYDPVGYAMIQKMWRVK
ncbi:MAG: hypothetical protein ACRELG_14380 [Gemmataceae bacterium]